MAASLGLRATVAVIIGKRASNVRAGEAMDHVFGYTNFIDGSARGLLPAGNTFYQRAPTTGGSAPSRTGIRSSWRRTGSAGCDCTCAMT